MVWLNELDKELQQRSHKKYSLDDVVRVLMEKRKVSLSDLILVSEKLAGGTLVVFQSPLLK